MPRKPISEQDVLTRLANGSKLRWVTRDISGIKADIADDEGCERDLFLDRIRLDDDEEMMVVQMKRKKKLVERNDGPITFYELP